MPTIAWRSVSRSSPSAAANASCSLSSAASWSPSSQADQAARGRRGRAPAGRGRARPVGQEVAGERREHLLGLVVVAAGDQQPAERGRGVGVARVELERAAQRLLVVGGLGDQAVGLGRDQRVEERLDLRRRDRAGELVDDLAVLERLDRRDALDAGRPGQLLVGVHVDLGQLDLAVARLGGLLERRRQLPAGAAPRGPEVHDDRDLLGALDDVLRELELVDVLDRWPCDQV